MRITKAPDERRSELIATAQQLFYSKGYENTSVSDIVKAVGVAKGTFYYYFDAKVEILEALVDEMMRQMLAIVQPITENKTLTAVEKWQQFFQVTAAWKSEHKAEIISVMQTMYAPENILLRHKIEQSQLATATSELAKIIEQGVAEGVFETEFVVDSAEITFSIMRSTSDHLIDLVLNPEKHADRLTIAQTKFAAIQTAVERVLGAPQGLLPVVDDETLAAWFSE